LIQFEYIFYYYYKKYKKREKNYKTAKYKYNSILYINLIEPLFKQQYFF